MGGSIGSKIVRQVARLNPSELIMLDREENRIDPLIYIPVLGGR